MPIDVALGFKLVQASLDLPPLVLSPTLKIYEKITSGKFKEESHPLKDLSKKVSAAVRLSFLFIFTYALSI